MRARACEGEGSRERCASCEHRSGGGGGSSRRCLHLSGRTQPAERTFMSRVRRRLRGRSLLKCVQEGGGVLLPARCAPPCVWLSSFASALRLAEPCAPVSPSLSPSHDYQQCCHSPAATSSSLSLSILNDLQALLHAGCFRTSSSETIPRSYDCEHHLLGAHLFLFTISLIMM